MEKRNWVPVEGFDFKEILFEEYDGIAKITINRPRYRNAFTPRTTWEMSQAFAWCREAQRISVVLWWRHACEGTRRLCRRRRRTTS